MVVLVAYVQASLHLWAVVLTLVCEHLYIFSAIPIGSILVSMAVKSPSNGWRFSRQVHLHLERLQWSAQVSDKD